MPGSIFFKPLQCQFNKSGHLAHFNDPYVAIETDNKEVIRSHRAKNSGDGYVWDKESVLELRVGMGGKATLHLRDADKKEPDDEIGDFKVDLDLLETKGHSIEWYDIYDKNKAVGRIQLEGTWEKDKVHGVGQNIKIPESFAKPDFLGKEGIHKEAHFSNPVYK